MPYAHPPAGVHMTQRPAREMLCEKACAAHPHNDPLAGHCVVGTPTSVRAYRKKWPLRGLLCGQVFPQWHVSPHNDLVAGRGLLCQGCSLAGKGSIPRISPFLATGALCGRACHCGHIFPHNDPPVSHCATVKTGLAMTQQPARGPLCGWGCLGHSSMTQRPPAY